LGSSKPSKPGSGHSFGLFLFFPFLFPPRISLIFTPSVASELLLEEEEVVVEEVEVEEGGERKELILVCLMPL